MRRSIKYQQTSVYFNSGYSWQPFSDSIFAWEYHMGRHRIGSEKSSDLKTLPECHHFYHIYVKWIFVISILEN